MVRTACIGGLMLLALTGCAPALTGSPDLMPPPRAGLSGPIVPAALGQVEIRYQPLDPGAAVFVKQALRRTLQQTGIFDESSHYLIHVDIEDLQIGSDAVALNFSARATGKYHVFSSAGNTLYRNSVESSGHASLNETLVAAIRQDLAIRRAISNNIAAFREDFILEMQLIREILNTKFAPEWEEVNPKSGDVIWR